VYKSHNKYQVWDLAEAEHWVETKLASWFQKHSRDKDTCSVLYGFLDEYHEGAVGYYSGHPERMSNMFLTSLTIRVFCDKAACAKYPLMADYTPEVPSEVFCGLLLPTPVERKRLSECVGYVQNCEKASKVMPSIYVDCSSPHCFAARFVEQSEAHQDLLRTIQVSMGRGREAKIKELEQKQEEYRDLHHLTRASCSQIYLRGTGRVHDPTCGKCDADKKLKRLRIRVFEEALPKNDSRAAATVFEPRVPPEFDSWRNASLLFIRGILKCSYANSREPNVMNYRLSAYRNLSRFFRQPSKSGSRLTLLTEIKPVVNSHYREIPIGPELKVADVCKPFRGRFRYFDQVDEVFSSSFDVGSSVVRQKCSYSQFLPTKAESLAPFMASPSGNSENVQQNNAISV
jgi:hypothetical protein